MIIWSILQPFGTFFPFWFVVPRNIWQACLERNELWSSQKIPGT
jgi:hypothetical protein